MNGPLVFISIHDHPIVGKFIYTSYISNSLCLYLRVATTYALGCVIKFRVWPLFPETNILGNLDILFLA